MKVEAKVNRIETTGFGRGNGECLGAPFPKLSLSVEEKMRTSHDYLI